IGALVRRIEAEKLAELVDRQDKRLGRVLAHIRVAHPELAVGAVFALWIGVDELTVILARDAPAMLIEILRSAIEQELVRIRCACRRLLRRASGARAHQPSRQHERRGGSQMSTVDDDNHRYSAWIPSSSETAGAKPRSWRARDVSA